MLVQLACREAGVLARTRHDAEAQLAHAAAPVFPTKPRAKSVQFTSTPMNCSPPAKNELCGCPQVGAGVRATPTALIIARRRGRGVVQPERAKATGGSRAWRPRKRVRLPRATSPTAETRPPPALSALARAAALVAAPGAARTAAPARIPAVARAVAPGLAVARAPAAAPIPAVALAVARAAGLDPAAAQALDRTRRRRP